MHVIAALDAERKAIAERLEKVRRPGAERDHRLGAPAAFASPAASDHPAPDGVERPRVARQQAPAAREEQIGIGFDQRAGIGGRRRLGEMDAAGDDIGKMRLERGERGAVQNLRTDAIGLQFLDFGERASGARARCETP